MTANTPRSRKAKGMSFQKQTVEAILKTFPELTENDVRSIPGSVPGPDIWLSERARQLFNFDVECKCQEKINIWDALAQLEERELKRINKEKLVPVLFFKRNRSNTYACLKASDFFDLVGI